MLFHACGESIGVYRCPNKKVDGYAVYTNTVPAGAFRGYGSPQIRLRRGVGDRRAGARLGMDPFEFRRRNVVRPGDPMVSADALDDDVDYGSYGLDQCLDLVQGRAAAAARHRPRCPAGLADGEGVALTMIDTVPPRGHLADAHVALREDGGYELAVGTAEFGNGTTTVHCQIAATVLGTTVERIRTSASPTPGTAATTPAPMAAPARWWPGAPPSSPRKRCATHAWICRRAIRRIGRGGWRPMR